MSTSTMKYGKVDFAFAESILNKLGGVEGAKQLLSGDLILLPAPTLTAKCGARSGSLEKLEEALKKPLALLSEKQTGHFSWHQILHERLLELKALLDKAFPSMPSNLKVWKTLKLGTHKNADSLRKAMKKAGHNIGDWANDILGKPDFIVAENEVEVELVQMTVAEMGFKNGASISDIYAKADQIGLDQCPAEVGPQLRLQYTDQPLGEWIVVAMKPIKDSDGSLDVFGVGHDDYGLWLDTCNGGPDNFFDGSLRFVFVRRK